MLLMLGRKPIDRYLMQPSSLNKAMFRLLLSILMLTPNMMPCTSGNSFIRISVSQSREPSTIKLWLSLPIKADTPVRK